MGRLNLKLMQGIEEAEGQINKDKGQQTVPVPNVVEEKLAGRLSDKAERTPEPPPKPKASPKKAREKPSPKQVFSFRASLSDITVWRAYATATGETMENIGCMAMNEYIKRHRLDGTKLAVFEALKAKNEDQS